MRSVRATLRALARAWPAAALWIALAFPAFASPALASPAAAGLPWCAGGDLGWHFYCDPAPEPAPPDQPAPPAPPSAVERLAAIRAELKRLRAEAILNPTADNLAAYMRYQAEQVERASVFSDQWRRVVWSRPALDYTLRRPVGTLAKRRWIDRRRAAVAETLAAQTRRRGLFYLFAAPERCPDCAAFATILQSFAAKTGIAVVAVSADGATDPAFPDALADRGRIARLGLGGAPLPAVVLYDAAAGKTTPVGFGLLTEDQLARRIYALTKLPMGEDY